MPRSPLLIFPCNGNAIEALDCLGDEYEFLGFVDDTPEKQSAGAHGFPVYPRQALKEHRSAKVLAVPGSSMSFRRRQEFIEGLGVADRFFALRVQRDRARTEARMLEDLTTRDSLTGLYNRRYMEDTLDREIHRARRNNTSLGIMVADIDHFKDFNDTYGHDAGDVVL